MENTNKIFICEHCNQDNLRWTGWIYWDEIDQKFAVDEDFIDGCWCLDCEKDTIPKVIEK